MIEKTISIYEMLNQIRTLKLKMIQKLYLELGIPAESLIK